VDVQEAFGPDELSDLFPDGGVRRDESRDSNLARVVEKFRNFRRAAEVLGSLFGRESQIAADSEPHVLTVEHDRDAAVVEQPFLQFDSTAPVTG
jgi:hypothetical protein